jgi:hypothetical protein
MSNPLKRRMARAALLLAAGAAPVVSGGGQASAAELPTSDLSGLTALDNAAVETTLGSVTETANGMVEELAGDAARTAMPIIAPAAEELAAETAYTTGALLHSLAMTVAANSPSPYELEQILPSLDDPDLNGITL